MGVYIPTWEKPDNCLRCPFHKAYEDGTISCELPESSPDDCKMVDVKAPHGRLVDESELREWCRIGDKCRNCSWFAGDCQYNKEYSKMDLCTWLNDAPTVIEQEDE